MSTTFKHVTDYFGLSSASGHSGKLVPIASDSGDNKQHICAYNATSEAPATATSNVWRNPTVTYRVVGDLTLAAVLGKAFVGTATISGYMIVSVEVVTSVGQFPTVTVSGCANEGVDAINKTSVSIPILATAHAQNIMNCVSGGGELQEMTFTAICDPIIVAENNMPCASDAVHERYEARAVIGAFNGEAEPTAGSGFTQIGAVATGSDVDFKTWQVAVRKEL